MDYFFGLLLVFSAETSVLSLVESTPINLNINGIINCGRAISQHYWVSCLRDYKADCFRVLLKLTPMFFWSVSALSERGCESPSSPTKEFVLG